MSSQKLGGAPQTEEATMSSWVSLLPLLRQRGGLHELELLVRAGAPNSHAESRSN